MIVAGCGEDTGNPNTTPTATNQSPGDGSIDAPINGSVRASFNVAMDPDTLNDATFTVTSNCYRARPAMDLVSRSLMGIA